MRHYSSFDQFISQADHALRTVMGRPSITERPDPANSVAKTKLTDEERKLSAGLMRVNHSGEVSAQALYQGQALTARLEEVRSSMERAALEENDHLAWTEKRLDELGSHKSILNPLWYAGSFAIGAFAGAIGDKWSLGFVAETEHQVIRHLDNHLSRLPASDSRSKAILLQMKEDEAHHATIALEGGGAELPWPVKKIMQAMSKVMTTTAYYI
ncbi:MAG: 2-polyprenyl-3-methyl-6-methoxy-1,4-benzoquinone monooxygenase [Gammaproteobacteria bacterium]|nr:2-polyprenyl-3-methyl-6-methoxy-1,4-benzoquinone monooxygenase [Gammaproteobacteria bacterium]MDH5736516.1 2-polyprenyl-3-methyl-6-methoxy-1,4-benzoquinone monooxygenase [Gammaproteobacteria bacterium]